MTLILLKLPELSFHQPKNFRSHTGAELVLLAESTSDVFSSLITEALKHSHTPHA